MEMLPPLRDGLCMILRGSLFAKISLDHTVDFGNVIRYLRYD